MKLADVHIGDMYQTKVSGEWVVVVAKAFVTETDYVSKRTTTKIQVARTDNLQVLPKLRSAAALSK